jgi:thiamine-monophosphate kinase
MPLSTELRVLGRLLGRDPLEWALSGGEDYELLVVAPPTAEASILDAIAATGLSAAVVGEIRPPEEGLTLAYPDGRRDPLAAVAFRHF